MLMCRSTEYGLVLVDPVKGIFMSIELKLIGEGISFDKRKLKSIEYDREHNEVCFTFELGGKVCYRLDDFKECREDTIISMMQFFVDKIFEKWGIKTWLRR
ncbi:MAG: hypothetical protein DRJ47_11005 [Thermoprotei archaeon]|nr:MAG: hypothetical protein DRJ47_11005 [Thermoprotei archaeon]